jgi:excisionase family DNA binding protein
MPAVASFKPSTSPTAQEMTLARESSALFQQKRSARKMPLTVIINDKKVDLPGSLSSVLGACLDIIADGHSVAVMPVEQEIGTQEAADMLGVSRPYLVKLLDSHAIPSRKVGVQRRLRVGDLMDYKERKKAARREVLAELAAEGQRLGLGE